MQFWSTRVSTKSRNEVYEILTCKNKTQSCENRSEVVMRRRLKDVPRLAKSLILRLRNFVDELRLGHFEDF
jgi:hypothetical protein